MRNVGQVTAVVDLQRGRLRDRADRRPDERAVALLVVPGVEVVGDPEGLEARLLGHARPARPARAGRTPRWTGSSRSSSQIISSKSRPVLALSWLPPRAGAQSEPERGARHRAPRFRGGPPGKRGAMRDESMPDETRGARAGRAGGAGSRRDRRRRSARRRRAGARHRARRRDRSRARPVYEAGGGESEGFEQAEELLIEHASHGDEQPPTRSCTTRAPTRRRFPAAPTASRIASAAASARTRSRPPSSSDARVR